MQYHISTIGVYCEFWNHQYTLQIRNCPRLASSHMHTENRFQKYKSFNLSISNQPIQNTEKNIIYLPYIFIYIKTIL